MCGSTPNQCQTNYAGYEKSYAVTGGWATKLVASNNIFDSDDSMLDLTQRIVCL